MYDISTLLRSRTAYRLRCIITQYHNRNRLLPSSKFQLDSCPHWSFSFFGLGWGSAFVSDGACAYTYNVSSILAPYWNNQERFYSILYNTIHPSLKLKERTYWWLCLSSQLQPQLHNGANHDIAVTETTCNPQVDCCIAREQWRRITYVSIVPESISCWNWACMHTPCTRGVRNCSYELHR